MNQLFKRDKRDCFGDSNVFEWNDKACRACPHMRDGSCFEEINATQPKMRRHTVGNRNRKVSYVGRPHSPNLGMLRQQSTQRGTPRVTQGAGNALMVPVEFNHDKPLLRQYMHYVALDTAEAMATRAVDLVRSCREEYARELLREDDDDDADS